MVIFSEPRSRGFSLFGLSRRKRRWLKPNSEKAGEPASWAVVHRSNPP